MATTILASLAGRTRSKLGGIAGSLLEFHSSRLEKAQVEASGARGLARHEPEFRAAKEDQLSLAELIALLGDGAALTERDRQEAIACYLSASEGWADAARRLRGAFAAEAGGLRDRKID
jgi:hypothetical protein